MKRIILATLLASASLANAGEIRWQAPIEQNYLAASPADRYEAVVNGRNNIARPGYANCPALEEAWEQTFNYVSDWLEGYTGIAQPHLGELTGSDAEDRMNDVWRAAERGGIAEVTRNVQISEGAFHLWFRGCMENYQ